MNQTSSLCAYAASEDDSRLNHYFGGGDGGPIESRLDMLVSFRKAKAHRRDQRERERQQALGLQPSVVEAHTQGWLYVPVINVELRHDAIVVTHVSIAPKREDSAAVALLLPVEE